MQLIKIICGFYKFPICEYCPLQPNVLRKCVRRSASEAALKEVTPHSHKFVTKCCTPAGMLSKEMIDKKCKYSIYSFVLTFCVGIYIRAQRE